MATLQRILGNYFGNLIRASRGIYITNTNLNNQTNWITWTPAFVASTQTVAPSAAVMDYRRIADEVYLNVDLTFTYTPPGAADNVVSLTGFPVEAATGAMYTNLCVVEDASSIAESCRLNIDPSVSPVTLNIILTSNFVPASVYTIRGQIVYKAAFDT